MNQQPTTLYSRRPTEIEINDQEIEEEEVVEVVEVVKVVEQSGILDSVMKAVVLLDLIKIIF